MSSDDGHIARFGIQVVEGDVLLHGQVERLLLRGGCRLRILPDILARGHMFHDAKRSVRG